MSRTLMRRGLAVVSVSVAAISVTAGPVSASDHHGGRHPVVVRGQWSDPGVVIDSVTPSTQPGKYVVDLHGTTHATGDFAGDSTYTLRVLFDPATNVSVGTGRETYPAATLSGRGHGSVTFAERVQVNGDGSEVVRGRIVAGNGVFRGAHGAARFTGQTDPTGANPGSGPYVMWIDLAR